MRKIKVAMLAPCHNRGSVTVYINKLAKQLSYRDDIELHVITIGDKNREFNKGNSNVHVIKKSLPYPFSIPSLAWSLRHKIIEIDPDIINTKSIPSYSTAAALLRNRYPTLLTALGIVVKEFKFYKGIQFIFSILINKPNEKYTISKIPNIIVEAQSIKNLISDMTKSKIYIVPNGIDFEKIRQIKLHLNDKPDIFLAPGLTKIKGVDILIKAIPTVINSLPNLSVRIAGSGPQENELKSLVKKLNIEGHVKFLGFISEEDKYQYYKACKLVVVPSRWDCQPTTLLEAMSSGKPVVASRIGGIQDTVKDGKTGFLFKSENIKDLADKIITLLKDEELREEMGNAAKEKAKSYDWSKIAERTVEIYKEVIADFHERKAKDKKREWKS